MATRIKEVPLEQAKLHPACFMYVWATNDFLNALGDVNSREIIRTKGWNQLWLMDLSAKKEGITLEAYKQAVYDAFVEIYGITPFKGLIKLASGETFAGKNWSEGVYGVGSLLTTFADNKGVTVTKDGQFKKAGKIIADGIEDEIGTVKGKTMVYKRYYTDPDSKTVYAMRYHGGRYYADSYSLQSGEMFSPAGIHIGGADGSTVWGNVIMNVINAVLNWFLGLLGVNTEPESEQLTDTNTLPKQIDDGFAGVEPMISGSTALMLLAGGGMLLASGAFRGKKGKKK